MPYATCPDCDVTHAFKLGDLEGLYRVFAPGAEYQGPLLVPCVPCWKQREAGRTDDPVWRTWPPACIENAVACLTELSDIELQRAKWVRGEGDGVWSFAEAVCGLFDDTGLSDTWFEGSIVFGGAVDADLKHLQKLISETPGDEADDVIISSEGWPEIVTLAEQCLAGVRAVVNGS